MGASSTLTLQSQMDMGFRNAPHHNTAKAGGLFRPSVHVPKLRDPLTFLNFHNIFYN